MDPFTSVTTIWSLYKGYKKGTKIANWLNDLYYGDETNLEVGKSYYDAAGQSENSDRQVQYLLTAVSAFEQSVGQKKYIDATAYFYLAMCHLRVGEFKKSYEYLDKLQSISTDTGVVKKDYIVDFKQHGKELREVIKDIEQKVKNKKRTTTENNSKLPHFLRSLFLCLVLILSIGTVLGVVGNIFIDYYEQKNRDPYVSFTSKCGLSCYGTESIYIDTTYADFSGLSRAASILGGCTVADFDEKGNWAIFQNEKALYSEDLYFKNGIKEIQRNGWHVIDFSLCNKRFSLLYGGSGAWSNHLGLKAPIEVAHRDGGVFRFSSFNSSGEWILSTNKFIYYSDDRIKEFCYKAKQFYGNINYVYLSDKGRIAICENGIYFENLPSNIAFKLRYVDFIPTKIKFSDNGFYVITNDDGKFEYKLYNEKTVEKEIKRYCIRFFNNYILTQHDDNH